MFKKNHSQFTNLCLNFKTLSQKAKTRIVMITSSNQGEGKTTIAINLTRQLAEEGKRVLIVDADIDHQDLSIILNAQGRSGFLNLLKENDFSKFELYILNTQIKGLEILPIGNVDSKELSFEYKGLFEYLRMILNHYDYIIFDSSVINNPITRSLVINSDGVILVARQNDTLKRDMLMTKEIVNELGGKTLGWVLNAVK